MRNGASLDIQNVSEFSYNIISQLKMLFSLLWIDYKEAGNTALHFCFIYKYKKIAEYLTIKGANTSIRNAEGQTCYHMWIL